MSAPRDGLRVGGGAAGMTLIEVLVSSAILALLSLILMTATVPLTNQSNETAIALDMDRIANKLLTELRRDLRQSGYDGGTPQFGNGTIDATGAGNLVTAKTAISFNTRTNTGTTPPGWSTTPITWRLNGTSVERTLPNSTSFQEIAGQVSNLTFEVASADQVCKVTLTLSRTTNRGVTVTRSYVDQIEMMNR